MGSAPRGPVSVGTWQAAHPNSTKWPRPRVVWSFKGSGCGAASSMAKLTTSNRSSSFISGSGAASSSVRGRPGAAA